MGNPTFTDVHVSQALTDLAIGYTQEQTDFVADKVFPVMPVRKQTDRYFIFDKSDFFRDDAKLRAAGTESAGGGQRLSTSTYSCDVYAYHEDVPFAVTANADFNTEVSSIANVTQKLLLRREKLFASSALVSGLWANDLTGVASAPSTNQFLQWNDAASNPITDVETARARIKQTTGKSANVAVIGYDVYKALKDHPDIVARIQYSGNNGSPAQVTVQALAALFEVENLFVMGAVEESAKEGDTSSMQFINRDKMLLCYRPRMAGFQTPSAGYLFSWQGYTGIESPDVAISQFALPHLKSDRYEGEIAVDAKITATDLGTLMLSVVA
jgi:hypothetical protein